MTGHLLQPEAWRNKPTDRFVLRWIKYHLSSKLSPSLSRIAWIRPAMITVTSAALGAVAGVVFGLGRGWQAGLIAACSQILDGVDGQMARLTGRVSAGGALLDSVLDRYADAAMLIGMVVYLVQLKTLVPTAAVLVLGFLALVGSSTISYTTARAESLGIDLGPPTRVSKGTRMTAMVLAALGSAAWRPLPLLALVYLAVHPNVVIVGRLARACSGARRTARGAHPEDEDKERR